ncbi:MAG: DUF2157 domain-containing protein [Candidatus Omnitrophica bacterium]|nr:DUF2157 domain-containing protein [Candidatus Omnitrophota bacterium]
MNKVFLRWLYQELPGLVEKDVLSQEAADKIRQFYGEVKNPGRMNVGLVIFGTIGAFLIGLGIILLFAHNWDQLPRLSRAVLSLSPLIIGQILALWVLLKKPQSGALKESTATFLSLAVGAAIALISQTYNIHGDAATFILTWMLLILPLVYIMQASLPAVIYLIGITAWAGSNWDSPARAVIFWPLAAIIVPHLIWALRQEIYALRAAIVSLVMAVCVLFAASFSLGRNWPGLWVVIFPSIFAVIYFTGNWKFNQITTNWQKPLRFIGGMGLFVLVFQFTFKYCWQYLGSYSYGINRDISFIGLLADYIITLAIIATAVLLFYDNLKRKNNLVAFFGAAPLLAIVAYFLNMQSTFLPLLIFNLYLFVLSLSRIVAGFRLNNQSLLNTGMLMLSVLIIARFFDSDISFIIKGLVFIIVGIGFLMANLVYTRRLGGVK